MFKVQEQITWKEPSTLSLSLHGTLSLTGEGHTAVHRDTAYLSEPRGSHKYRSTPSQMRVGVASVCQSRRDTSDLDTGSGSICQSNDHTYIRPTPLVSMPHAAGCRSPLRREPQLIATAKDGSRLIAASMYLARTGGSKKNKWWPSHCVDVSKTPGEHTRRTCGMTRGCVGCGFAEGPWRTSYKSHDSVVNLLHFSMWCFLTRWSSFGQ